MLQIHYYLSCKKGFLFTDKIYSTKDLGPFAVVCKIVFIYYYNKYASNSHTCHSKLYCDLWQQASHILGKET